MANEKTSKSVAKKASKGLRTGKLSKPDTKSVSGSALTNAPDKAKPKAKAKPKPKAGK